MKVSLYSEKFCHMFLKRSQRSFGFRDVRESEMPENTMINRLTAPREDTMRQLT